MDHPVVTAFDRIATALAGVCAYADGNAFVLAVGPQGPKLQHLARTDTLVDVEPPLVSHHMALALSNGTASVLEAAKDWCDAIATLPALEDLCAEGLFVADTQYGGLCLDWIPNAHFEAHGPRGIDFPTVVNVHALRASLVAATAAAQTEAPLESLTLLLNGPQGIYARARTTQDVATALLPFLCLDHTTAHLVGARTDVALDPSLQKARRDLPTIDRATYKRVERAVQAWTAHVKAHTPAALSRGRFFLPDVERTHFVHLGDEPHYDVAVYGPCAPFSDDDIAWMEQARALWQGILEALPSEGLWRCAGVQAFVDADGNGETSVQIRNTANGFWTDEVTIPIEWLLPVAGSTWMVQTEDMGTTHPVLARTPLEAAAIGWMAFHGPRPFEKLALTVWLNLRTVGPTS
jgi:hypothetical protein